MNGEVLPLEKARISVTDPGFLTGDGCMETVRIHRGSPFLLPRHLQRLEESRRLLGLPGTIPTGSLRDGARSLLETAAVSEGLLRITMTAPDSEKSTEGTIVMTTRPLPDLPSNVMLHVCESLRRVPGPLSAAKTTSRALEAAALREAKGMGAFDAILLNPSARIVETTARNIFLVRGGVVTTPPLSEGALPGITREVVLALGPETGLSMDEIPLPREALIEADEVFLTGSGVGVLGVAAVGSHGFSAFGPCTRRISDAYSAVLDRESQW